MKPKFFKSEKELKKWFEKYHNKKSEVWVGLYKKGIAPTVTQKEAVSVAMSYGWIYSLVRSIDEFSYQLRCVRRKNKSIWSLNAINYAKHLIKTGQMKKPGLIAFQNRDKKRSQTKRPEFKSVQLKQFKSNKKAWEFYTKQTPSYQRYTMWWVVSAVREETQKKRLEMLIEDSENQSKLRTIVAALEKYGNKIKQSYEPGKTPIETIKNIGPATGAELRSVGIETVEKLQDMGWEEAFVRLTEMYPHRKRARIWKILKEATENF